MEKIPTSAIYTTAITRSVANAAARRSVAVAGNWGFAKLREATIIFAKMSDSDSTTELSPHTVPYYQQQPMLVSFSHFLAVLLEEAQRPSLPPSCGVKWMRDSADLEPCEPDALILRGT